MSRQWYYRVLGEQRGPFSAAELREEARLGRINRDTWILKKGSEKWVTADRVKGLLDLSTTHSVREEPIQNDEIVAATAATSRQQGVVRHWKLYGVGVIGVTLVVCVIGAVASVLQKGGQTAKRNSRAVVPSARSMQGTEPKTEPFPSPDRPPKTRPNGNNQGKSKQIPQREAVPFELKGDRVGVLSLAQFKRKYARKVGGMLAPFSSDSTSQRGNENPFLLSRKWHSKRGIVHATTYFPFEKPDSSFRERSKVPENHRPPTIAGVPAEFYVHKFVDGILYEIEVWFDSDRFYTVNLALREKFGRPTKESQTAVQNRLGAVFENETVAWSNGISEVVLEQRSFSIDTSVLRVTHVSLSTKVESRRPRPDTSDL